MSQSSPSIPSADLPHNIPTHVAIIMDGNGRWATSRGLPRMMGHRAGTENLRSIIKASVEFGIQYLTIYAFSTENWGRPNDEVEGLMHILSDVIDNELEELNNEGVKIRHIGRIDRMQEDLRRKVLNAVKATRENRRLVLCVAWNYGSRDEIVYAIQHLIADGKQIEEIDEDLVSQYLFTAGIPDPDLVIRTSGEMRISNFLTWQSAYSEWYFTPTLWPDFDKEELRKALEDYSQRDRRFGRLSTSGC
jgi:undecaprenyl diphosphate synthase